jgi:RNA polymerase sigma-70 factor (ECF subfamily)
LQQALAALSEPHRVVVLMYYFEDCSYREIAEQLDLPIGTVMSRLARAKRHLRDWLTCPQSSPHTG